MWDANLGIEACVHVIEGVHFIWSLLNTGFTVCDKRDPDSVSLVKMDSPTRVVYYLHTALLSFTCFIK